jgi:hypothetical protein
VRRLNTVAIDHVARDLAINGHSEPRFHKGYPVWRRDLSNIDSSCAAATIARFITAATNRCGG